jgi:NTP pyrophosphatase (non-canonical NTP hydrolase)
MKTRITNMDINSLITDLETISLSYANLFDVDRTPDWFMLKLTEELGEMTQSYLNYQGQSRKKSETKATFRAEFADKIADVLCMVLLVAKHHDIDVEQAITRKWLKYLPE